MDFSDVLLVVLIGAGDIVMAWDTKSGDIVSYVVLEDEIRASFNYFFSDNCFKTSTYKHGFLKAILDNLFSGEETARGVELTFQQLFSKFAENYWNLIMKYHLRQMRKNGKSNVSGLEKVFYQAAEDNAVLCSLEYASIQERERCRIEQEVQKTCKKYVIGALYGDFEGKFYGFSFKECKIWLNPVFHAFLMKYKLEIEKLNYYAWAKMLEKLNKQNPPTQLMDKLELATPKRNSLAFYRDILQKEFASNNCFYCGKKLSGMVHVDHVIPWQLVREDRLWNFVLACPACNTRKNNRLPKRDKLDMVIKRNEIIVASDLIVGSMTDEFKNYSEEMMLNLWQYAKMGGYREWV